MSTAASFRYDINFLRALAVTSVLLFHFGVQFFSGGYAGVDVFFVISGYLMGAIICKGLDQNKFSLLDFYIARVKRIIPALIVLCASCLILGWFLLAPDDYSTQALHVRDSLLFISNETYRDESGYFDASSHEKWLLHTWSLSVEWQFYLLLPLIIAGLRFVFRTPQQLFNALAVITMIAFLVCVDKSAKAAENAFFLLKYRCWEMLLGVLVFLLPQAYPAINALTGRARLTSILNAVALSVIAFTIFYFDSKTLWPSWRAALPVAATAVIILTASQYSFYKAAVISWLGSRSYSLYLWHWPLVVLLAYYGIEAQLLWVAAAIIASLCLAELSFRFIEEPARKAQWGRIKLCLTILTCAVVVGVSAQLIIAQKGFPDRVSAEVKQILKAKKDRNNADKQCIGNFTDKVPECQFGSDRTDAVVIGDSHAHSIVTGVLAALPEGSGVKYWGYLACPTISSIANDEKCSAFNQQLKERVKALPVTTPVIIASRFSYYPFGEGLHGYGWEDSQPQVHFGRKLKRPDDAFLAEYRANMSEQLCTLASGRNLYVLLPVPEMIKLVPQTMARAAMRGERLRVSITRDDYLARNGFILEILQRVSAECGVKLLDPRDVLCDDEYCYGDQAGRPLYYDDDHLNESGNKILLPLFHAIH